MLRKLLPLLLLTLLLAIACATTNETPIASTTAPTEIAIAASTATLVPSATATSIPSATVAPTPAAVNGDKHSVAIDLFMFPPITIKAGDTVVWTNNDAIIHSVTAGTPDSPTGLFDSDFFDQGEAYSREFPEAGEFTYFCKRHNFMQGTVVVEAP